MASTMRSSIRLRRADGNTKSRSCASVAVLPASCSSRMIRRAASHAARSSSKGVTLTTSASTLLVLHLHLSLRRWLKDQPIRDPGNTPSLRGMLSPKIAALLLLVSLGTLPVVKSFVE